MHTAAVKPRHAPIFARDPDDWYVEPSWCSERLFQVEKFDGAVHDPCAGTGRIIAAAVAAGLDCAAADPEQDFFASQAKVANVVSNPPFKCLRQFATHALSVAEDKVALLLPVARLNAAGG